MNREENLARISVVLVQPEDCQNIGSVCRAAKTMGIGRLKIVGRSEFDEARVRQLSVHAFDLFEKKMLFKTLDDALGSSSLSIAFTRRIGKFRKGLPLSPSGLAEMVRSFPHGDIDLVFGRESDGLTDDEVCSCNMACAIETSSAFPSLNLSQAVQIAAYSLFTGLDDYADDSLLQAKRAAVRKKVDDAVCDACALLGDMRYFKESSDEEANFKVFLRDSLLRGAFSEWEIGRIGRFFRKVHDISKYKGEGFESRKG